MEMKEKFSKIRKGLDKEEEVLEYAVQTRTLV